ncbi:MAG: DUF4179 domain-containing protein [Clostridiales bacterium]|nr:DUF4179 domain-containing protein [Clostridiales bacterium]
MLGQGGWKNRAPKASEKFHNRLEESLRMIEEQQTEKEKSVGMKNRKKDFIRRFAAGCTGVAAAAAVFVGVCYQNPVWAAELPLIGHIFEKMEGKLSYGEDYEKYVQKVENPQEAENENQTAGENGDAEETAAGYSQTVNGTTVTMSESYCSGSAVYLSLMIRSEKPFTDTFIDTFGMPILHAVTEETYSFAPEMIQGLVRLEGDFIDSHTYAGVMRMDLSERIVSAEGKTDIPEKFSLELTISQIVGDLLNPKKLDTGYSEEELEAMPDEEWEAVMKKALEKDGRNQYPNENQNWWIDGAWTFDLDIAVDETQKQVQEVQVLDENGAGILSVEKTPFEITANTVNQSGDFYYTPVMLDAQGKVMESESGSTQTAPVRNYDTSTVYVYMCEDIEDMEELKGQRLSDPEGFKALMEEKAVLKAEVHFE